MECITTSTLTMLVNGKSRVAFHPEIVYDKVTHHHHIYLYVQNTLEDIFTLSTRKNSGIAVKLQEIFVIFFT